MTRCSAVNNSLLKTQPSTVLKQIPSQWAIGHVTDDDLVPLLVRLKASLKPCGVIVLKENVLSGNGGSSCLVDLDGCSLRRSNSHFKALFARSGCRVLKEDMQKQLPSDLCRVKMWALR